MLIEVFVASLSVHRGLILLSALAGCFSDVDWTLTQSTTRPLLALSYSLVACTALYSFRRQIIIIFLQSWSVLNCTVFPLSTIIAVVSKIVVAKVRLTVCSKVRPRICSKVNSSMSSETNGQVFVN